MLTFLIDETSLAEVIKKAVREEISAVNLNKQGEKATVTRKILRGMKELEEFLGCCPATALKLKKSGKIPYRQVGRKVLFDAEEVLRSIDPERFRKSKKLRQL
jgi:hypothetical protein